MRYVGIVVDQNCSYIIANKYLPRNFAAYKSQKRRVYSDEIPMGYERIKEIRGKHEV